MPLTDFRQMPDSLYSVLGSTLPTTLGNIDIANRPRVRNQNGSISTVRSMGINVDGNEVLIPTVSDDGRIMSPQEAVQNFKRTGRHLGMFKSAGDSNAYARQLHDQQALSLADVLGNPQ